VYDSSFIAGVGRSAREKPDRNVASGRIEESWVDLPDASPYVGLGITEIEHGRLSNSPRITILANILQTDGAG